VRERRKGRKKEGEREKDRKEEGEGRRKKGYVKKQEGGRKKKKGKGAYSPPTASNLLCTREAHWPQPKHAPPSS
jgi:hypothetical protein